MESIAQKKMRSLCYSVAFLRSKLECPTTPIPGLGSIPNTVAMDNSKKKTAISEIKVLFNSVTKINIDNVKKDLHTTIIGFLIKTTENNVAEEMNGIANEILRNFIVSECNIKIYVQLLNAIFNIAVNHIDSVTGKPVISKSIAHYFINNCRALIFKYISEEHMRVLAMKNLDDDKEEDYYNREKAKICNLIITICSLYDQRNTTEIKLTAVQIYGVINAILIKYAELMLRMKKLGNPYEEDCEDEIEYECLSKMSRMYAEQIIVFLDAEYQSFINDKTVVQEKVMMDGKIVIQNKLLLDLVVAFRTNIYPNINEPHLIQKCEMFDCFQK